MTVNFYAPAIRDAIKRGNLTDMRDTLRQAKQFRRQTGDLDTAIERLEKAIAKLSQKPSPRR